jgi:uncharacterized protein
VQNWFAKHGEGGWATCPLTQAAFVRILSNPAFSPNALTPRDSVSLLESNLAHASHKFWPDDLTLTQALDGLSVQLTGHQQITDAYLLGLAMRKGAKLASMDRSVIALLPAKQQQDKFVELI